MSWPQSSRALQPEPLKRKFAGRRGACDVVNQSRGAGWQTAWTTPLRRGRARFASSRWPPAHSTPPRSPGARTCPGCASRERGRSHCVPLPWPCRANNLRARRACLGLRASVTTDGRRGLPGAHRRPGRGEDPGFLVRNESARAGKPTRTAVQASLARAGRAGECDTTCILAPFPTPPTCMRLLQVIDDALFSLQLLVADDASIEDFVCLGGLQVRRILRMSLLR